MKRICILLITVTLLAGMVGCEGDGGESYTLAIASTTGGNVTTPGEGIFTYDEGTVVDLVAMAEECYGFTSWAGDVGTIGNISAAETAITMHGNYSITADFEERAVHFPDPNLEAAIREAIAIPEGPIYPSDLDGLTSLNASVRDITDLTGLECCYSLTELSLLENQINDITRLSNLTSLTWLSLGHNQITDISPLANLTSLQWLNLGDNQITDISPLASLTNVTHLNLWSNQISDISPLADLTSLTYLKLDANQISDISPLADNEGLAEGDEVHIEGNPLSSDSINIYIPELEARGVDVYY